MLHENEFIKIECLNKGIHEQDIPVYLSKSYAQCAEDLIIASILKAIAVRKNINLCEKRYLEIGANHPIATSASYLMHTTLQMNGVLVEANSQLIPPLQKVRPSDTIIHAAITATDEPFVSLYVSNQNELSSLSRDFVEDWHDGAVGLSHIEKVPALRVNELLENEFPNEAPIYVSIDIEGLDYSILQDWDWARWRPTIVQVEPSDHFIADNSSTMRALLESNGYLLIALTDVNLIAIDTCNIQQEDYKNASLIQALPLKLQSGELYEQIMSGKKPWWKIALQQPWNITIWQTARRLQRLIKNIQRYQ